MNRRRAGGKQYLPQQPKESSFKESHGSQAPKKDCASSILSSGHQNSLALAELSLLCHKAAGGRGLYGL